MTTGLFDGCWILIDGYVINEQNEKMEYSKEGMQSTKVLAENSFCFMSKKNGAFYAAGSGKFSVENDVYTEELDMASWTNEKNLIFRFECTNDGKIWKNSKLENEKIVEYEVWEKQ